MGRSKFSRSLFRAKKEERDDRPVKQTPSHLRALLFLLAPAEAILNRTPGPSKTTSSLDSPLVPGRARARFYENWSKKNASSAVRSKLLRILRSSWRRSKELRELSIQISRNLLA